MMTLGLVVLIILIHGFVISFLWNLLMVPIFELPYITIFQAIGLRLLACMFFNFDSWLTKMDKGKEK